MPDNPTEGLMDCSSSPEQSCGVPPQREAELAGQGWERRSTLGEPRLSEAVEVYRDLGFEVHLEPFDPSAKGEGGCTVCFEDPEAAALFKTLYTRGPRGRADG